MLIQSKKNKKSEEDVWTFTVRCEHVDCEENVRSVINKMCISKINDFERFTGKKVYRTKYNKLRTEYSEEKGWTGIRTGKCTLVE